MKQHTDAGQIELDVITEATTANIRQKLREKPYNVFHFIGHGDFQNEKGYIALLDEEGKAKSLDDENFANFFLGNSHLGLIILNCCRSATVSSNQAFAGTVSNLVRRGIPAAIAMQYTISDSTAKLFADEFYKPLALGFPVDTAIQETRNAISKDVFLVFGGLNRYFIGKVHLRGLANFEPVETGFVCVAATYSRQLKFQPSYLNFYSFYQATEVYFYIIPVKLHSTSLDKERV